MWKNLLEEEIEKFIQQYRRIHHCATQWGKPLVGFASIYEPVIQNMKGLVGPSHMEPQEVLPGATVILSYYLPFTPKLAKTNRQDFSHASPQWAQAYEETNRMFMSLNEYLMDVLQEKGYTGVVPSEAYRFDRKKLISNWSQKHIAYAAGLGTFGIHKLLITPRGCCGRFSSIVTDLDVECTGPMTEELCLYKKNGSCGKCMAHCPVHALEVDAFHREKCYGLLLENAHIYRQYGNSYEDRSRGSENIGSEVCGKCITSSPCSFW